MACFSRKRTGADQIIDIMDSKCLLPNIQLRMVHATHGDMDMFLVQLWLLFCWLVIPFARHLKPLRKHET